MSDMRMERLADICEIVVGRTPSRNEPTFWGQGHPWLSIADMNQGLLITQTKEEITDLGATKGKLIPPGTVLLSFKLSIGKVSIAGIPLYTNEAIAALIIKEPEKVDSRYLMWTLKSMNLAADSNRAAMGATLNKAKLQEIRIPVPPLNEQIRKVQIEDIQYTISQKRERQQELFEELKTAVFYDLFGTYSENMVKLGEVADITSGITKGRKTSQPTREIPYLAVANVQAGSLKLDNVKTIEATEAEIEKYRLQKGDIIITEGGDPDKLGRGTVWNNELPEAIHQNHIFRIRLHADSGLTSEFVEAYLSDSRARRYFMRNAKQTTGIASINKKQIEFLPVLKPTKNIDIFQKFIKI